MARKIAFFGIIIDEIEAFEKNNPFYEEPEHISQILFTPKYFEMPLGKKLEPFSCRATIYDTERCKRISEYFNFQIGEENQFKHFIFQCDPSPDIIMLIHIDRYYNSNFNNPLYFLT